MAKINLTGDALVITSTLKAADLQTVEKYAPTALVVREKDEDSGKMIPVFKVTTGSAGSISAYGVCFSGESRDGNGFATLTIPFTGSKDAATAKAEIADKYGAALAQLNKVEAALPDALKKIAADRDKVVAAIVVG